MKPKLKIEDDHAVIQGTLTIKHHKEVFQIMKKLSETKLSKIIVNRPSEIDLSSVQMLWSLQVSKQNGNSPIGIVFDLNESDQSLLKRCGFSFFLTPTL